ncbi:MAG: baseplate J/gp47 family protein [Candidatus Limnocylindrales bacterium]
MAIYYLDVNDEITSAAARIRDSSDNRIALVLSGGSRVATSRINFRLLAGEAKRRNKRLAIVAADPTVQSVARSADLPVFATVGEYEKAETARASGGAEGARGEVSDTLDELALTVGPRTSGGRPTAGQGSSGGLAREGRAWPGRIPRSVFVGLAAVAVLVVGLGAFFFYPSATVALTLRQEPVGPLSLSVTVDPNVSAPNDGAATVPGSSKTFPVGASGSFDATGQHVDETAATGTVTFISENTLLPVPIPAGTQVTTAGGVAFATTAARTVPKAVFATGTRGTIDAPVTAVKKGTAGNVPAKSIVKVPSDLAALLISVSNADPTTGGTHTETPMIVQADIDKAESNLMSQIESGLQAAIAAPGAVPSGSTLFSVSARLGVTTFDPDPKGLLNQTTGSFDLNARATGTAVVADLSTVRKLAEGRIRGAVRSGYSLVDGSIATQLGTAAIQGDAVVVPVTAQGLQSRIVDAGQVRTAVQGKSVEEARTYLAQFGQVDISVSPGWASTMPSFDFRIDVQLVTASPPPTAGASQSGSPAASEPEATTASAPPAATPGAPSPNPSPS